MANVRHGRPAVLGPRTGSLGPRQRHRAAPRFPSDHTRGGRPPGEARDPGAKVARPGHERGTTSAEYLGVIVVVAAIISALTLSPVATTIGSGLSAAVCRITGQSGCTTRQTAAPTTTPSTTPGTPPPPTPGDAPLDAPLDAPAVDPGPPLTVAVTDDPNSCDGALDCTGNALAGFAHGAWTGLRDEATGTWSLITDPGQLVDAGKAIWDDPLNAGRQLVWDDESAAMADQGDTAGAAGRTTWNIGSWFLPGIDALKISKLEKITKLSKITKLAEIAEKLTALTRKAETAAAKAEEAAKAGRKAEAETAATEARKAADDAKKETEGLNCPLALPPPGGPATHGGGGHGPVMAAAPRTTRLATDESPCAVAAAADDDASRAENAAEDIGGAREIAVAELTDGTVAAAKPGLQGKKVVKPNVGSTDVDVIGSDGAYIAVGGPAKAKNVNKLRQKLIILKYAADEAGVPAKAYFEAGTPRSAIDAASEVLGEHNVVVFER